MLLDYVPTDVDDDRLRELFAADAAEYGKPSLFARAVANNPDVLAARVEYVSALREAGSLDRRLAELAYATVAVANACEYCVASHTDQLIEHVGLGNEEVEAIVTAVRDQHALDGSFDERDRAVVAFARAAASAPKRVSETEVEKLYAVGFDDRDVVQLVALVSAAVAANTIADVLTILPTDDPDGERHRGR